MHANRKLWAAKHGLTDDYWHQSTPAFLHPNKELEHAKAISKKPPNDIKHAEHELIRSDTNDPTDHARPPIHFDDRWTTSEAAKLFRAWMLLPDTYSPKQGASHQDTCNEITRQREARKQKTLTEGFIGFAGLPRLYL